MSDGDEVSVSTTVGAPPAAVHAIVSDVTRMGEWSPECVKCEWTDADRTRFKGYNRRGVRRWSTTSVVVANEPGREFTFDVSSVLGLPVARWSYRFEPTADGSGTVMTETWQDRRGAVMTVLGALASGVRERPEHNRAGMEETLARIKAAVDAGRAGEGAAR